MEIEILIGLAAVLGLGIAAQWLAWRFHLPAILLLMLFGMLAGPFTGFLDPDAMFGAVLIPVVSISIGIILFEGGLELRLEELKQVGGVVRNLVTVGLLVNWILTSIAAYFIFSASLNISLLIGAVLVVTGPTVIIPLLRHIRLTGKSSVGTALKWEGIVIDPIGAVFAVLILQVVIAGGLNHVAALTFKAVFYTILVGGFFGLAAAAILITLFRHHLVPDFLKNPVALALVVVSFVCANVIQHESGLLATTLMGIVLANQRYVRIKQLAEFKETLRVLLISGLFIVLSARIDLESFSRLGGKAAIFTAVLVLIVRPLSVIISTAGSDLSFREKIFLSALAPRGIVAAAVASIFAVELAQHQEPGAELVAEVTFMVIIGTVTIYGLFSPVVARMLGLSTPHPQGMMFVGAHPWARDMAVQLKNAGCKVFMVDTNASNVMRARELGISAQNNNVVFDPEIDELVLDGIGKLIALTPNDEVNTLSGFHFIDHFGEAGVYQLSPQSTSGVAANEQNLPTRVLFGPDLSFTEIEKLYDEGGRIETIKVDEDADLSEIESKLGASSLVPFFHIKENGDTDVFTAQRQSKVVSAGKLVCLVSHS